MGFFGSIFRAAGRGLGKVVSWVGEKTGIDAIREAGDNIQYACRETSHRTGSSREYDRDYASVDQTANMADILAGFSTGLYGQGQMIEQVAKKDIEAYFDQLYIALDSVLGKGALKTLNLQKQLVLGSIDGSFNDVLTRRVSLADSECLNILKMPQGFAKEKEMNAFGVKIINEGIENLCANIQKSVEAIRTDMAAELSDMVETQRRSLKEYEDKAKEVFEKRQSDIESSEAEIFFPAKKLAAAELLLDMMHEGATT